jgi:hypothetical protein
MALFELTHRSWSVPEALVAELLSLGLESVRYFPGALAYEMVHRYGLEYINQHLDKELPPR